jgi:hypothetical protein
MTAHDSSLLAPLSIDNVIREALAQKLHELGSPVVSDGDDPSDQEEATIRLNITRLHDLAESYCRDLHPLVINIIRRQLDSPSFFQWDASLVRNGSK